MRNDVASGAPDHCPSVPGLSGIPGLSGRVEPELQFGIEYTAATPTLSSSEPLSDLRHPELSRILLVEDEEDIQRVVRLSLESLGGFRVETAANGGDALECARRFQPQLILLDVMMPGLDGPSTLQSLRAEESLTGVPVIFLTARAQPHEVEEYFGLGAFEVIVKPFDPFELPDVLRRLWARHLVP